MLSFILLMLFFKFSSSNSPLQKRSSSYSIRHIFLKISPHSFPIPLIRKSSLCKIIQSIRRLWKSKEFQWKLFKCSSDFVHFGSQGLQWSEGLEQSQGLQWSQKFQNAHKVFLERFAMVRTFWNGHKVWNAQKFEKVTSYETSHPTVRKPQRVFGRVEKFTSLWMIRC